MKTPFSSPASGRHGRWNRRRFLVSTGAALTGFVLIPWLGIQQSIVDLNLGLRPDLSIVDGSVGQSGEGPLYGRAAGLGVLVAGLVSVVRTS